MSQNGQTQPGQTQNGQTQHVGIQSLIGDALRETTDLARKEIALFRTEMSANMRTLFMGLGLMVGAGVFAIAAILLLTQALVKWLATVVHSEALAALIVAVAMILIGVGLALWGRSTVSASTLAPTRTTRSVREDARLLSEKVS